MDWSRDAPPKPALNTRCMPADGPALVVVLGVSPGLDCGSRWSVVCGRPPDESATTAKVTATAATIATLAITTHRRVCRAERSLGGGEPAACGSRGGVSEGFGRSCVTTRGEGIRLQHLAGVSGHLRLGRRYEADGHAIHGDES